MNTVGHPQIEEAATNEIMSDINRLSELENFGIFSEKRLDSVNQICATAQIAFSAQYCVAVLVDHKDAQVVGSSGFLPDPESTLRTSAIAAICEMTFHGSDALWKCGKHASGHASHGVESEYDSLAVPIETKSGYNIGALCVGLSQTRQLARRDMQLAKRFAANCLQLLEAHKLQTLHAQRAAISRRQAEKLKAQKLATVKSGKLFAKVSRMARIVGWEFDIGSRQLNWSGSVKSLFGITGEGEPKLHSLFRQLGHTNLRNLRSLLSDCLLNGDAFDLEISARTFAGAMRWFRVTCEKDVCATGSVRFAGTIQDVSDQRERESLIQHVATHDDLTGLANRKLFKSELASALNNAWRHNKNLAVILIDADNFKQVNDNHGHNAGDQVLREFASHLKACFRSDDLVSRLGGDEFGVLIPAVEDSHVLEEICERIQARLACGIDHDGGHSLVSASIGIAIYPSHSLDAEDLLHKADLAMYHSKENGRAVHSFYSEGMQKKADDRIAMIEKISVALESGKIIPYYQPIIDCSSGGIVSLEALARWHRLDGEVIPACEFIEALKDPKTSVRISQFMMNCILQQIAAWKDACITTGPIAINLSNTDLETDATSRILLSRLQNLGLGPSDIVVEVTESVLLARGASEIKSNMQILSDAGVAIALDDFGTGYASLTHLKEFPVDIIKIDKTFISQLPYDEDSCGIVKATIELAKNLGLNVVAEGVETEIQAQLLRKLGCEAMQGYLFSKPVGPEMIPTVLNEVKGQSFGLLKIVGA